MEIEAAKRPAAGTFSDRRVHRITCVGAGGLAVIGGTLALFVNPWFAVVAAIGGIWLIVTPEPRGCAPCCVK